ncbi:MAG: 4a-hydroxytetrahydrobiopterin dehydratase [Acidimicrobiales bacterium]
MRALSDAEIAEANLAGWTHTSGALRVSFAVPDYETAARFITDVAHLAETANHHPDLSLRYGVLDVVLRTHHRDLGVTDLDVDMAGQITVLAAARLLEVRRSEAC